MFSEKGMLQQLRLIRNKVRVRSHLFKMETKEKFRELEIEYSELKNRFERAKSTSGNVGEDIWEANRDVIESIKSGYEELKNDLKKD